MSSPIPDRRKVLGAQGEEHACRHLTSIGYTILDRNWRQGHGELDIVARSPNGILVFVEVKTSRGRWAGDPGEWITPRKQEQVAKVALAWLTRHQCIHEWVRFDAILVRQGQLEHIEDAFRPQRLGF